MNEAVVRNIQAFVQLFDHHQCDILMDGGVRSGLEVSKALALGAKATFIGRPWIYALAARGEAGLTSQLKTINSEMNVAMALSGTTDVAGLMPEILDSAHA